MSKDTLFQRFIMAILFVMLCYGIGMMVVIIVGTSEAVATRLITGFSAMFSGVLGLGAGYLLGRSNGNGYADPPEDG